MKLHDVRNLKALLLINILEFSSLLLSHVITRGSKIIDRDFIRLSEFIVKSLRQS